VDGFDLRPEASASGRKQYPLVLMLEPLFRCNLACAGCGKIQYPAHILKKDLTPEECFRAVDECGAPMVSIPGGEPLMHPQIDKIVDGPGGAQEIHLPLHQRAAAERKDSTSSSPASI
jgi:molybdenum cofactor biosynthesis enzyme MoaA